MRNTIKLLKVYFKKREWQIVHSVGATSGCMELVKPCQYVYRANADIGLMYGMIQFFYKT